MPDELPLGWTACKLGQIAAESRERFLPGRQSDTSVPYVGLEHIEPGVSRVETFGTADEVSSQKTAFSVGDVLFGKLRPYLRKVAQVDRNGVCSTDILALRPRDCADAGFLLAVLSHDEAIKYATSTSAGTKMPRTSWSSLSEYPVLVPPLPEQKKIAAILSSVDEVIQATQLVIDQTRRVKEGLLQDLLTRGLPGHTRFKQTEIGEIPEDWTAPLLDEVSHRGSGHTPDKKHPEYWGGDIKWVSLADSHRLDDVFISETTSCITPAGVANSSAVVHPAGSVLVSRDASVGRSAIMVCDMAVSQHFIAWRCSANLDNLFLYYVLQKHKPRFEQIAAGSTIKTIGLGYFKKLRIPLPALTEQRTIATRLLAMDETVWELLRQRSALVAVKAGLLQDLLTGRVRVSP